MKTSSLGACLHLSHDAGTAAEHTFPPYREALPGTSARGCPRRAAAGLHQPVPTSLAALAKHVLLHLPARGHGELLHEGHLGRALVTGQSLSGPAQQLRLLDDRAGLRHDEGDRRLSPTLGVSAD